MINMVYISDKQKLAMSMIDKIVKEFGADRWFVQAELPGITQHSMDALINKGYLETKCIKYEAKGTKYEVIYYRRLKTLECEQ